MARKKIKPFQLEQTVDALLAEYGEQVFDHLQECVDDVTEEAVDKLKAHTTFRRRTDGEYAGDWTSDKEPKGRFKLKTIIHNEDHYRLTHLLENGHVIRNGTGRTYGRTEAFPHIKPVDDWMQKALVEKVKEKL